MASYAPLLGNLLDGVMHNDDDGSVAVCPYVWSPIMIGFNSSTVRRDSLETVFSCAVYKRETIFCQDRVGTNTGNMNKRTVFTGRPDTLLLGAVSVQPQPGPHRAASGSSAAGEWQGDQATRDRRVCHDRSQRRPRR